MPRVGMNPLRFKTAPAQFPPVLCTVVTHLPNEEGYHASRFEIVKRCLETMRAGANNAPVLVWDNGSCDRLKEYLTNEYKPEWLMFSGNVGKQSALAAIYRMLPADTLASYSDDDMEYSAGWLDASLELYRGFPNVGAVSVWATRPAFAWGNTSTLKWAQQHATIESGYFIPLDEVRDYYRSVGGDGELEEARYQRQADIRITHNGLTAYAQAQHCQFLARAGTFVPFTAYQNLGSGDEKGLDLAIDRAGLLRLNTTTRYARHMGNRL